MRMESTLIAFALLVAKDQPTYRHVFDVLAEKVFDEFGGLGGPKVCEIIKIKLASKIANIYEY